MKNLIKTSAVSFVAFALLIASVGSAIAGGEYSPKNKHTKPRHQDIYKIYYSKNDLDYKRCLEMEKRGKKIKCIHPKLDDRVPVSPKPVIHKPYNPKKDWLAYKKCLEMQKRGMKIACHKPVHPVYNPMPPSHTETTWEEYQECLRLRTVALYHGGTPPCKKPVTHEYDRGQN